MIRNVAREIAMHLCYELSFTGLTAGELLEQRLASPYFESLAPEYEAGRMPYPISWTYPDDDMYGCPRCARRLVSRHT